MKETQARIFSNLKLLKPQILKKVHIYNNLMTFIYLLRNKKSFPIELIIQPSVSSVHSGIKGLPVKCLNIELILKKSFPSFFLSLLFLLSTIVHSLHQHMYRLSRKVKVKLRANTIPWQNTSLQAQSSGSIPSTAQTL